MWLVAFFLGRTEHRPPDRDKKKHHITSGSPFSQKVASKLVSRGGGIEDHEGDGELRNSATSNKKPCDSRLLDSRRGG